MVTWGSPAVAVWNCCLATRSCTKWMQELVGRYLARSVGQGCCPQLTGLLDCCAAADCWPAPGVGEEQPAEGEAGAVYERQHSVRPTLLLRDPASSSSVDWGMFLCRRPGILVLVNECDWELRWACLAADVCVCACACACVCASPLFMTCCFCVLCLDPVEPWTAS